MTTNFHFLTPQWPALAEAAAKVEGFANSDPRTACFWARRALELAVSWLFDFDSALRRPYDRNLAALLAEPSFNANVPPPVALKCRAIKDLGNLAVHCGRPIRETDARKAAQELFHVCYWLARTYARDWKNEGLKYDPNLLPKPAAEIAAQSARAEQQAAEKLKKLSEELAAKDKAVAEERAKREDIDAELAKVRAGITLASTPRSMPENRLFWFSR